MKPRIFKRQGRWFCAYHDTWATGETPTAAYVNWMYSLHTPWYA